MLFTCFSTRNIIKTCKMYVKIISLDESGGETQTPGNAITRPYNVYPTINVCTHSWVTVGKTVNFFTCCPNLDELLHKYLTV